MTADQEKEVLSVAHEFITLTKNNPAKTFTLRLLGKEGEYRGGGIEISIPGGKGMKFVS